MSSDEPAPHVPSPAAPQGMAGDTAVDHAAGDHDHGGAAAPRVGSPFAVDPPTIAPPRSRRFADAPLETGVWRVTAGGAVLAAMMLAGFALAGLWSFPVGTALTAALGGAMSLMGLSSRYPRLAVVLLAAHLALFLWAFAQMA